MLIVIVIIGILAAALIPRLTGAQGQARDTARLADLNQIGTALAVYQADNDSLLPATGGSVDAVLDMLTNGYIKSLPKDPKGSAGTVCWQNGSANYAYYVQSSNDFFGLGTAIETEKKGNSINGVAVGNCDTLAHANAAVSTTGAFFVYFN